MLFRSKPQHPISVSEIYGKPFPSNAYMNDLQELVSEGIIMYLDDDDHFFAKDAIKKIVTEYKAGNELIFWQVRIGRKLFPSNEYFGKEPKLFNISGIGYAFDAKYKELARWEPYKRGDYRVAKKLWDNIENIGHIKEVLTSCQKGSHFGNRIDLIENEENRNDMKKLVEIKILKDKFKGNRLKHNIGEIKKVPESVAKQLIRFRLAKLYDPNEKEPELVKKKAVVEEKITEPIIEKKVMEPKKIEKVMSNSRVVRAEKPKVRKRKKTK